MPEQVPARAPAPLGLQPPPPGSPPDRRGPPIRAWPGRSIVTTVSQCCHLSDAFVSTSWIRCRSGTEISTYASLFFNPYAMTSRTSSGSGIGWDTALGIRLFESAIGRISVALQFMVEIDSDRQHCIHEVAYRLLHGMCMSVRTCSETNTLRTTGQLMPFTRSAIERSADFYCDPTHQPRSPLKKRSGHAGSKPTSPAVTVPSVPSVPIIATWVNGCTASMSPQLRHTVSCGSFNHSSSVLITIGSTPLSDSSDGMRDKVERSVDRGILTRVSS